MYIVSTAWPPGTPVVPSQYRVQRHISAYAPIWDRASCLVLLPHHVNIHSVFDSTSYTNVRVFRPFSGDTLSSLSCSQLGCSSFLRVPREHILFSLASCVISHSNNMTHTGQPYVLATLPPFAANILQILRSKSVQVFSSIKELKTLMKVKVTTEAGEDLEKSDEGESGDGGL